MCARWLALIIIIILTSRVEAMPLSSETWRERKLVAQAEKLLSPERIVDLGIRIHVVRQDLKSGTEIITGKAPVSLLSTMEFGGQFDTRTRRYVGKSRKPVIWCVSEEQLPLVLHDESMPSRLLVYGAMGAGKTRGALVKWLILRALELGGNRPPAEIGGVAPTDKRLIVMEQALRENMPADWYSYKASERLFTLRNGVRIRLVAAKEYSAAIGSPIQGWNWSACGVDEHQDLLHANGDIEARGRAAPKGVYRRLSTATAKDSPDWRAARDKIATSPNWGIYRLDWSTNPFEFLHYWEALKHEMDEREYQRKVLALDVGPERMVYHAWDRDQNLRPRPQLGANDITAATLKRGPRYVLLGGHDPGKIQDVTLVLKAYQLPGKPLPHWWVIDEITTKSTTPEEHGAAVLARLRTKWHTNLAHPYGKPGLDPHSPLIHIRADPYGDTDNKPDISAYKTLINMGLEVRSAAYKQGKGKGRVPKEAGIAMVNMLLCNAAGERRLFIDCDDRRQPCAPNLVRAIEMSERNEAGEAEAQKKGKEDLSHWPASLRYALWPYERVVTHGQAWRKAQG